MGSPISFHRHPVVLPDVPRPKRDNGTALAIMPGSNSPIEEVPMWGLCAAQSSIVKENGTPLAAEEKHSEDLLLLFPQESAP